MLGETPNAEDLESIPIQKSKNLRQSFGNMHCHAQHAQLGDQNHESLESPPSKRKLSTESPEIYLGKYSPYSTVNEKEFLRYHQVSS